MYLGYQVKHLKNQKDKLDRWLEKIGNQAIRIYGKKVIGNITDYGLFFSNFCTYPWDREGIDNIAEIKNFEVIEKGCSFVTNSEYFQLEITDIPSDQWGNELTDNNALLLVKNCKILAYIDDSFVDFSLLERIFDDNGYILEDGEAYDFLQWAIDHYPLSIDRISTTYTGGGLEYFTTNLIETSDWQSIITTYLQKFE